jgi:hypothetical protein
MIIAALPPASRADDVAGHSALAAEISSRTRQGGVAMWTQVPKQDRPPRPMRAAVPKVRVPARTPAFGGVAGVRLPRRGP